MPRPPAHPRAFQPPLDMYAMLNTTRVVVGVSSMMYPDSQPEPGPKPETLSCSNESLPQQHCYMSTWLGPRGRVQQGS